MAETDDFGPMDRMKEAILKEYPRLSAEDKFRFTCGPNVPCFNQCCSDVNIVLTPYDVLRLKNHLGITAQEFLDTYCVIPFTKMQRLPVVLLRMREDGKKTCHFVTDEGCSVYEDRPWACRMYPVGAASPKEGVSKEKPFFFLMREEQCKGFEAPDVKDWTIRSWMEDQGVAPYNEMGEEFKEVSLHESFVEGRNLAPPQMEMFFMACYDLDKFRRFVFDSSFLKKFDIDEAAVEKLRTDDVELLKLGLKWIRFSLFGEKTLEIRRETREAVSKALRLDKMK